jgi:Zn-finger nucleic acid-binding protein
MKPVVTLHHELERCSRCGAIWISLADLRRHHPGVSAGTLLSLSNLVNGSPKSKVRQCPGCKTRLLKVLTADVEIDFCGGCDGVFLDAGELEKLAERGASLRAGRPAPEVVLATQEPASALAVPETLAELAELVVALVEIVAAL